MPTMRNLLSRESTDANFITAAKSGKAGHRNFKSQHFVRTRSALVQPTLGTEQINHDRSTGIQPQPIVESPKQAPTKVNTSFASSFMASLRRKPKQKSGTQQHQAESGSHLKTTPAKNFLLPTNTPSATNIREDDQIVSE